MGAVEQRYHPRVQNAILPILQGLNSAANAVSRFCRHIKTKHIHRPKQRRLLVTVALIHPLRPTDANLP